MNSLKKTNTGLTIMTTSVSKYVVIDRHTGAIVSKPMSLVQARRSVDKRDNAYGAYRFGTRRVEGV
jgi:hypothetical protein